MDHKSSSSKGQDKGNADREHLKNKARQGATNVVEALLEQPQIQKVLMRQALTTGFVISAILIGAMSLLSYLKSIYNIPWIDLPIGIILLMLGLAYFLNVTRKAS